MSTGFVYSIDTFWNLSVYQLDKTLIRSSYEFLPLNLAVSRPAQRQWAARTCNDTHKAVSRLNRSNDCFWRDGLTRKSFGFSQVGGWVPHNIFQSFFFSITFLKVFFAKFNMVGKKLTILRSIVINYGLKLYFHICQECYMLFSSLTPP